MFTLQELKTTDKIIVAGHRGYSGRFPENSLLAFREAAEAGCDMIELDVTLSKDGVPVTSHDDCLERVSDGSGMIADHTCEELKEFDFGIRHGEAFRGIRIPTFRESLELFRKYPRVLLDIDFKISPQIGRTLETVQKLIREFHMQDRCIYNSCDGDIVSLLAGQGHIVVGAPHSFAEKVHYSEETYQDLWCVCIPLEELTPESAHSYLAEGKVVAAVSPDTPRQVRYALHCGARLLIADDPRCAVAAANILNGENKSAV